MAEVILQIVDKVCQFNNNNQNAMYFIINTIY